MKKTLTANHPKQNFPPYNDQTDRLDSEDTLYELIVPQLGNKHPAFYTTYRLSIMLTAARN
jgi:hypothetical protein